MKEVAENYKPSFSYPKWKKFTESINHAGHKFLSEKILKSLNDLPRLLLDIEPFDYFESIQKMNSQKLDSDYISLWHSFAHFPHEEKVITHYYTNYVSNDEKTQQQNEQYSFMTKLFNILKTNGDEFNKFVEFI